MSLDLDFARHAHLRLHNLAARFGIAGYRRVRVRPEGEIFVVTSDGREIHVPSALRWRMFRYGWSSRIARLSREFGLGDPFPVGPGDTIVDIGANVGEFSLAAAATGARVHAIEGDPSVFACLKHNVAPEAQITPHCQILWNREETLTFYSAPNRADSSIFAPDKGAVPLKMAARPLDDLADEAGIGAVALLKCDAEGAEPEVLEGALAVLGRTRAVAVDTGPERAGEETAAPVAKILTSLGFTVRHETRDRRKITFALRDT